MVVVDPYNVPFLVAGDDGVGETLVNGDVLGIGSGLVK